MRRCLLGIKEPLVKNTHRHSSCRTKSTRWLVAAPGCHTTLMHHLQLLLSVMQEPYRQQLLPIGQA